MSVETYIKNIIKNVYVKYKWKKQVKYAVKESKKYALAPSYFPEEQLKSDEVKIKENIEWAKKYGEPNKFYTLYGLDRVGSHPEDYMDYQNFMTSRNIVNRVKKLDSQLALLRDKYLFYKYMKASGLPVPEVFAVYKDGRLYDSNFNDINLESLSTKSDYFVKSFDGECASYVKHINTYSDLQVILKELQMGAYIFQDRVVQSDSMNALNPYAVNTYRIVTVNKNGNPYIFAAELRVGTSKTRHVDNLAAGGLAIGIADDGYLKEYGFYKPAFGLKVDTHPDTGVVFRKFKAPEYKEATELALKAHKFFYGVRAIGWDLAISNNGPVFIEGNDNWEISGVQSCDRPLRKEWEEAIS